MRKKNLIVRWSITTTILAALFWGIWYLAVGTISTTNIHLGEDWIIKVPRWWDVPLAPIFPIIFILLLTDQRVRENKDLDREVGLGLGLGLFFVLPGTLGLAAYVGLEIMLVAGLASSLFFGLLGTSSPIFSLVLNLTTGAGVSLFYGAAVGLGANLVFSLAIGLGTVLGALIRQPIVRRTWIRFRNWLLDR